MSIAVYDRGNRAERDTNYAGEQMCPVSLVQLRADVAAKLADAVMADIPCLVERITPDDGAAIRALLGPDAPAAETVQIPPPPTGDVFFDGMVTLSRPTNRGTTLQHSDRGGKLVQSQYLRPTEEIPAWSNTQLATSRRDAPLDWALFAGALLLTGSGIAIAAPNVSSCQTGNDQACTLQDVGAGVFVGGALSVLGSGYLLSH